LSAPPPKRLNKDSLSLVRPDQYSSMMSPSIAQGQVLPRHISQINGKPKIAHMTRTGSGRKQVISWMDAPDDVYFRATEGSK
jgi:metastasis-associated protein MTA